MRRSTGGPTVERRPICVRAGLRAGRPAWKRAGEREPPVGSPVLHEMLAARLPHERPRLSINEALWLTAYNITIKRHDQQSEAITLSLPTPATTHPPSRWERDQHHVRTWNHLRIAYHQPLIIYKHSTPVTNSTNHHYSLSYVGMKQCNMWDDYK